MATRRIRFTEQFFQTSPLQRFLLPNARPTGRQLGVGSYGSVEEVEVNGLTCAGKKLHETLIETGNFGRETIVSKYDDECQLMSDLRHPNIVQFLGLCFLPASPLGLPLLVMEKLSISLDDLLESSPSIPLAMKRSILVDVSRGLVYLHTHNPLVIHRDLSARNVLLNSAMMAKISDMGNSHIVDLQPGQLARTLSRLPGTLVYMAPEAFQETSRYGTMLDMFSFGHLGLFTVIQVFPGDLLPSTYPDPENPDTLLARSEAERRGAYFEQLQGQLRMEHPLERLIRGCLHNAPCRRPSAEEALRQLEDMRALLQDPYEAMDKLEMVRTLQEKDREIQQLQTQGQQPVPEANDHSRQQMEDLQQQMRQLQLDHSAMEETLRADLQTREDELREREAELQQRRTDVRRLTIELQTAQQQQGSLQADLQAREVELRERNANNRRLTNALQEKDREIQQLQTQMPPRDDHSRQQVKDLQQQMKQLQLDHSAVEETLRADLQTREDELREKGAELQQRRTDVRRLTIELRTAQQQQGSLQADLQAREAELRESRTELQQRNADNRRLTNELRTAQQQNSTHERTQASLRTDLQACEVLFREREGEAREREAEMSRLLRELGNLQSQLHTLQDERLRQREEISSLQRRLERDALQVQSLNLPLQLGWKRCENMPFEMVSPCSVVLNGKVYVGGGFASGVDKECTVLVYDLQSRRWDRLPRYRAKYFRMAVVNNQLVLVGGVDRRTGMRINQLSVWDERSWQWESELLPPMTTPRSSPSVCTYDKWLVAAGGWGEGGGNVKTVELLDTTAKQWYAAAPLPKICSQMTSAVVGDTWCLLGGVSSGSATKKVFSVSLPDLISQATSQPQSRLRQPNELWQELPDVPMKWSAALALHGSLLAVGGFVESGKDQSAIRLYQPYSRLWFKAGDLPTERSRCSCMSLPSGNFLVLGGCGGRTDRVDMGTVLD